MINSIVIVGGGFAGWYTAATIQHNLKDIKVTVVDSNKHPTIGVGETVGWDAPLNFERLCGFKDDREFMYETGAIYKFGVRGINFFADNSVFRWGKFLNLKTSALCNYYNDFDYTDFDEPWNRNHNDIGVIKAWLSLYHGKKDYEDFCLDIGELNHFLTDPVAPFNQDNRYILRGAKGHAYGYHIDAERSGWFIKRLVNQRNNGNVQHITSTVIDAVLDNSAFIKEIVLENGQRISADLFIDASGLQRVLMSRSSNNSWKSSDDRYSNSAWVCPSAYVDPKKEILGATEFFGEDWGWRFKIRLYHRVGNGYVFNSNIVDPEIPLATINKVTEGQQLQPPKLIQWKPGEFTLPWQTNLLPLGMAAGFIDPYDAPTFDSHSRALEDLVNLLKNYTSYTDVSNEYNRRRSLTVEERNLRLDITFGLSQRSGPYWDIRRQIAKEKNCLQNLEDIILERRTDLESRMTWNWHHQYIRSALAAKVNMDHWNFVDVPKKDLELLEAFYNFNRQRNKLIARQSWPNYSEWLQQNRFNGQSNQEVLARIQPTLCK